MRKPETSVSCLSSMNGIPVLNVVPPSCFVGGILFVCLLLTEFLPCFGKAGWRVHSCVGSHPWICSAVGVQQGLLVP